MITQRNVPIYRTCNMYNSRATSNTYTVILNLHKLFLFQCDVTRSLNRYDGQEANYLLTEGVHLCNNCFGILANAG